MHTFIRSTLSAAPLRGLLGCALLCLLAAGSATAQISWVNAGGGTWGEPLNWNPQEVPDWAGESALIGLSGPYTVSIDAGFWPDRVDLTNPQATLSILDWAQLTARDAGIFSHGTIQSTARHCGLGGRIANFADGSIRIPSGTSLTLSGTTLTNDGVIRVNADQGFDSAVFQMDDGDGMTLNGTGQLLLQGNGNPTWAEIRSIQGTPWTQDAGHTIRGDGSISARFVNGGLISADAPERTLLLNGDAKDNSGTIESRDGATLDVGAYVLQGPGGIIRADNGTVRILSGSRIENGSWVALNGGRFVSLPGTTVVCGVTSNAPFDILAGSRMIAGFDLFTNDGTITLNPDAVSDDAVIQSYQYRNVTFGGAGQIVMRTAGSVDDARMETTGETIINGPLHTIRGAGSITCPFDNHGRLSADVPAGVLLLTGGTKNNDGTIDAQHLGILELVNTQVAQTGAGMVMANGGIVRLSNAASIIGGTVATAGDGRIETQPGTAALCELTTMGSVDVLGGSTLLAGYDFLTNNGTITMNPAGSAADAILRGYPNHDVTLQGTGQLVMRTSGDPNNARMETTGEAMINGPTHTIRGEGSITCSFINHGLISADSPDRILRLVGGPKDNDGRIEARNQGVLEITSTQLHQGGTGTTAADGGVVRLQNGADVRYGALASANGGRFETGAGVCALYALTNGAQIDVKGGSQLIAGWGTFVNNGTITLNPAQVSDDAVLACCDYCNVTFDGTGEIVMCTAGNPEDARIVTYGWYMINGPSHTIRGEGSVHVTTQNQGTLQADVAGRALVIDGQVTNTGVSRATTGGRLELPARFENQGIAEAAEGGNARFGNMGGNYWSGGLHGGRWRVYDNSSMRLIGADISALDADVLLEGPNSNLYQDDVTGDALASLATIAVDGRLEIRNGRSLAAPAALANSGTLVIGSGSSLTVPAAYTQEGDSTHGYSRVDGTLSSAQAIQIQGGVLDGIGTISGGLVSSGDVRPGHSAGTMTIQGTYQQNAVGVLTIELEGNTSNQFDHLNTTGPANLAGTLIVRAIEGFHPQVGNSFPIMTRGGGSGGFDSVVAELGAGLAAIVEYAPGSVTVRIATAAGIEEPDESQGNGGFDSESTWTLPTTVRLATHSLDGADHLLVLDLPEAAGVRVAIYDPSGRSLSVPVDRSLPAGSHEWHWRGIADDGRRLPSGVYFVRAEVQGSRELDVRKARLILLR